MASIHKLTKNGQTIYPATTTRAVVDPDLGVTVPDLIEEINVSKIFPTDGIDGTNRYTLETAITMIPASMRHVGIKCSFLDEGGSMETYLWKGGTFTSAAAWDKVLGNKDLDEIGLNKEDESAFYVVDEKSNIVLKIDKNGVKAKLYNICDSEGNIILTVTKDYIDKIHDNVDSKVDKDSINETVISDKSKMFEIQDENSNIVLRISNDGIFLKKIFFLENEEKQLLDYQTLNNLKNNSGGTTDNNPIYDFFYVQIHNKVLFIGDSLTEGQTNNSVQDAGRSYPHACAKIGGWEIKNIGISGITALNAWKQIKSKQLDVTAYDAVFIYLGTNGGLTDTIDEDTASGDYNTFSETNTGGYCAIIEYIKTNNPKCKIYLIRWNDETPTSLVTMKIAKKYLCPSFKVKDNRYIDCTSSINHENVDSTHYNTLGYLNLARVIMIQLEEYIKGNLPEYTDMTVNQENSDRFN